MSLLASSNICRICPQQALEIEKALSASKVMYFCELVIEVDAGRQLLRLEISLYYLPKHVMLDHNCADSFSSKMQHTEEYLQSVLRWVRWTDH